MNEAIRGNPEGRGSQFWAKLFGTNMGLRTSLQQGNWHRGPAFIQQPLSSFHLSPHAQTGILYVFYSCITQIPRRRIFLPTVYITLFNGIVRKSSLVLARVTGSRVVIPQLAEHCFSCEAL